MEQTKDKLVICPCCHSNACYESQFKTPDGNINSWLCMTCGFTTNTTMTENSEVLKKIEEQTAKLIRDNKQVHDGLAWFPTVITMPNKGMIFPEARPVLANDDGKKDAWLWTVVKAIPVEEDEKEKFPIPDKPGEYYETKMDMKNLKRYDKLCFMDAAEDLGMFAKQPDLRNISQKEAKKVIESKGQFNDK